MKKEIKVSDCCGATILTSKELRGTLNYHCSKCGNFCGIIIKKKEQNQKEMKKHWEHHFWHIVENEGLGSSITFCQHIRDFIRQLLNEQ